MSRRVYLVGLMGAGKTTVGRQLAEALEMTFCDSDREIEQRTGANIPLIFDIEGESGFRKRERKVIEELTTRDNIVLATGGGAILDCKNRSDLSASGIVIYLQASVDQLYKRTNKDQKRPLLQTGDPKAKLQELLTKREPLYLEIADLVVKTDKNTIKRIIEEIQVKLSNTKEFSDPGPPVTRT
ncbi:MAG: shikimate kinase AroK [Gammaproteobacteria bacterium]|nr:shikimate kinase AroK [Gammaproteobacteria bacterium]